MPSRAPKGVPGGLRGALEGQFQLKSGTRNNRKIRAGLNRFLKIETCYFLGNMKVYEKTYDFLRFVDDFVTCVRAGLNWYLTFEVLYFLRNSDVFEGRRVVSCHTLVFFNDFQ